MLEKYNTFVPSNLKNMESKKLVVDYGTFLKEEIQNQEGTEEIQVKKLFYELTTQRIEVPVGGETQTKQDNKKETFDKILRRITKISKFIKIPVPILNLIEKKKYFALLKPQETGFNILNSQFSNGKNYTEKLVEVEKELEKIREEGKYKNVKIVSKDVEVYDLTMATIIKPEDEWVILGTVDYKDGLLKAAPGQQIPLDLVGNLKGNSVCDHCHKTIYRNKIVFVKNLKTDKIVRVGGSCIKNYLGYDYEKVLSYLTDISFLSHSWGDGDGDSGDWDEEGGWGRSFIEEEVSVNEIIKYFTWWYKNRGYLSKAAVEKINQSKYDSTPPEQHDTLVLAKSTSSLVSDDVNYVNTPPKRGFKDNDYEHNLKKWEEFCYEYYNRLKTISDEEVQNFIDFVENSYQDNNFLFNSRNMIKDGMVKNRLMYYVTGACSMYFGKLAAEERKRKAEMGDGETKKVSEWIGTVGEKMKLTDLEIVHIGGYEGGYGWVTIYKLKDKGNVFTKFGVIGPKFVVKKADVLNREDDVMYVGDVVSATVDIKDHTEYQGTKQTVLGRFSKL
jgi:hypothetical protein